MEEEADKDAVGSGVSKAQIVVMRTSLLFISLWSGAAGLRI
jgi:hypothetical protein